MEITAEEQALLDGQKKIEKGLYLAEGNLREAPEAENFVIDAGRLMEKGRLIEVNWDIEEGSAYDAAITIVSEDRKGLFSDISKVCDSHDVFISAVNTHNPKEGTITIEMTLEIADTAQLARLIKSFKAIHGVLTVYRTKN